MKKVLINVEERELRVAILEDEQLVELYIESLDEKSILNNIYKGRVEDVLPGLKAAFVNIGLERNAFLHFDDVRPDLIWAKYRELNPEMADEVPTAREALAAAASEPEGEHEDDSAEGKRKRRRGRRGGKKRRPDSEETYTPGLPVGVTEDDLEDEEDELEVPAAIPQETPIAAAPSFSVADENQEEEQSEEASEDSEFQQAVAVSASAPGYQAHGTAPSEEEIERRKQARIEKQKQRRERWEQKKLERQQRRQQERLERAEQQAANVEEPLPPAAPAVYGTRAAASAVDSYSTLSFGNQRRNQKQRMADKARYGDNFGNIAIRTNQRVDHRDSQVDFFGPAVHAQDEQHSIWDDRQPNLGPIPGAGRPLDEDFVRPKFRTERYGNERRSGGQQQNQNRKFNKDNKRRGGKKRNMRKRDNRSYFALSADDLPEPDENPIEQSDEEVPAPKKTTRKRKTSEAVAEPVEKKPATRKPAAKKTATKESTAPKTARKKKVAEEVPVEVSIPELPLGLETPVEESPKKAARTAKKPATPRIRKIAAKTKAETAELAEEPKEKPQEKPSVEPPPSEKPPIEEPPAPTPVPPVEPPSEPVEPIKEPESPEGQVEAGTSEAPLESEQPQERPKRIRETRAQRFARIRKERAAAKQIARQAAQETIADGNTQDSTDVEASTAVVPVEVPRHQQQRHPQQQQRRDQRPRMRRPQFQEVFKKGDEIMVQVVKEEIGLKGARISSYVSLPGRYLVLLPYPNQEGGISRKVEDIKERKRLKNLLQDISSDETAFIIRTAGVFQEETEIRKDVEFLSHEWGTIADRYKNASSSALVYDDHDIVYRLARDVFDDSVTEIQIDSHLECEKLKGILGKLIPNLVDKVKLYSGAENIFHKFGVTKQIQKAARRKVWLKSGGYLIIDEAEALTAIDVNTGKSVGKDDQEKLILRTNLESARAVARELKLRDIGGLIVIDFIDMKDPRNRDQVLHELKLQLRKDRSKTSVSAISEFGLVEMTRKRVRRSLRKTLFMDCPYCQGAGVVLNEQQIWLHIKHEVVRLLESARPAPTLNITVNPRIRAYIDQNYREVIRRMEQKYDTEIRFSMSDIYHIENYQIEKTESTGVITGSATMPSR